MHTSGRHLSCGGYNFEVPIDTAPGTPAQAVPLRHLCRFAHEAVAVDPATGAVYETEDQGDGSGFYRFMPSRRPQRPGDLVSTTGMFQMLKVVGMPEYETAINQPVGVPLPVEWVNINNPDPTPVSVVVFCEDATAAQHLRAVSPTGDVFDLARNLRNTIEFAGACFSPDGNTLFVNLYGRGNERTTQPYRSPVQIPVGPEKFERSATLAIWGPWKSGPL